LEGAPGRPLRRLGVRDFAQVTEPRDCELRFELRQEAIARVALRRPPGPAAWGSDVAKGDPRVPKDGVDLEFAAGVFAEDSFGREEWAQGLEMRGDLVPEEARDGFRLPAQVRQFG